MGAGAMSQTRLRAWLATIIWSMAGLGFALTFFTGGGPSGLAVESGRHLAGALALAFGFGGHWLALWVTRRRKGAPLASDERDLQTVARANQASLVVVLLGMFALAITLWTVYEPAGTVPVGWMWFIAYGAVILASVASAVATLVLDGRTGGHG